MTDKKTKVLAAIVFVAVIILSLLIAIRNTIATTKAAAVQATPITEQETFVSLNPLEQNIVIAFRGIALPDSAIESKFIEESESREILVDVPLGKPMEEIIALVQSAARKTSYVVEDSYYSAKKDYARMQFSSPDEIEKSVVLKLQRTEKDVYFKQNLDIHLIVTGLDTISAKTRLRFLTFEGTLSFEIPAWSDQLDSVAHVLDRYELPMIVKIPLESKGKTINNDYTLHIDDSRGSIETKISELTRKVPAVIAFSCEGGDRFLDTRGSTADLFEIFKDHRTMFIDNRKTSTDRAQQIASHTGIDYVRNIKSIEGETPDEYTQELRKIALSSRKEITVRAEASSQLITALEKNSNYFEKTGVTFKGITEIPTK